MKEVIIKALCNPVRLQLIKCLAGKEKSVSELISNCKLSQSAVSQHLKKLRKANLVEDKKVGREVLYSVKNKDLLKVSEVLLNLITE